MTRDWIHDFGIILACCDQDYMFAKGCCASIRHFLGEIPICLIIDGSFAATELEKAYGVRIINRDMVANADLRARSFGWGLTKMVAFWESPWQHFLFLDADTNVWGNLLRFADFENFEVVTDKPRHEHSDEDISLYFFDTTEINQVFPDFDWRKHRHKYFCTGTFFATKGIFSLQDYLSILDLKQQRPNLFKFGEMGLLNFMLCQAEEAGKIRTKQETMQLIVPDFDQQVLKTRFPVDENGSPIHQGEDVVIHWCGPKPSSITQQAYAAPMSFHRRKFIDDAFSQSGLRAEVSLKVEDCQHYFFYYKNKVKKKMRQFKTAVTS